MQLDKDLQKFSKKNSRNTEWRKRMIEIETIVIEIEADETMLYPLIRKRTRMRRRRSAIAKPRKRLSAKSPTLLPQLVAEEKERELLSQQVKRILSLLSQQMKENKFAGTISAVKCRENLDGNTQDTSAQDPRVSANTFI